VKGNEVGELIAIAMLLILGTANVLLTLHLRPAAAVAKSAYERKVVWLRKLTVIVAVAVIIALLVHARRTATLPPWAQGMFAAQMMAVLLAATGVGDVRQATIWFAQYGKPRMSLASVPLWVTLSTVAAVVDTVSFPRTLDVVMVWWRVGLFDDPHIPEGAAGGQGFTHQLYFAEQHVVLGVFTPMVIIMLLGAMAVWAKLYDRRALVWVPVGGFAAGLIASVVLAHSTGWTVPVAPVVYVCTVFPLGWVVWKSPYCPMLLNWSQSWDHERTRVTDGM
jgi:hypothetical protein